MKRIKIVQQHTKTNIIKKLNYSLEMTVGKFVNESVKFEESLEATVQTHFGSSMRHL